MKLFAICFIAGLSLAGCNGIGAPVTPSPTVALGIADALDLADTGYVVAASFYAQKVLSLSPADQSSVKKGLLALLYCPGGVPPCTGYLQAARDAAKIGDQTTFTAQIGLVNSVLSEVNATLHPAGLPVAP
jgi:hypothetical protein